MKTTTFVKSINPSSAKYFLEKYEYSRQRNVRKDRVSLYADEMKAERWTPGTQVKVAIVPNGGEPHRYLIDGQHRLHAVIESGTTQDFAVTEILCADDDEAARLYFTTDRGAVRTSGDMFRVYHLHELLGVNNAQMNAIGAAVKLIAADFTRIPARRIKSDDILYSLILDYQPSIDGYLEAVSNAREGTSRLMTSSAVMSIGLVTFRYAVTTIGEERVVEFWSGVAQDDGLRANDPRKHIVNHLLTTAVSHGYTSKQSVSAEYRCRYIASCWNAWTEGRTLAKAVVRDPLAPMSINGTPWKGK